MPRGIPGSAQNHPVSITPTVETAEQPIGQTARTGDPLASTPAERIGESKLIQVADTLTFDPEKDAMLKFMEEPVTIRPTRTTDPKELVFEVTINGRSELFRVGEAKTVKRYYVDHLARMKTTSYTQVEVFNAEGEKQYKHVPSTVLKYDFAMVKDDNPLGADWLKATLAMGG